MPTLALPWRHRVDLATASVEAWAERRSTARKWPPAPVRLGSINPARGAAYAPTRSPSATLNEVSR